jgi:hypothetical protein
MLSKHGVQQVYIFYHVYVLFVLSENQSNALSSPQLPNVRDYFRTPKVKNC